MKKCLPGINAVIVFSAWVVLSLFTACQKDHEGIPGEPKTVAVSAADEQLIASLGFDTGGIVDMGTYYVVEGDICIEKSALKEYSLQTKQYQCGVLVSRQNQYNISVMVDFSLIRSC